MSIIFIEDEIDLYSSRCMFDPNFMALALVLQFLRNMVKYVNYQNVTKSCKSQRTVKSRSRLNADGEVNLYSSRCMHNPSGMALYLIVSEKLT